MNALRRYWPVLALLAGVALAYFEIHRAGGVTAENGFWLLIAGLIVVMSLIDLFQKRPDSNDGSDDDTAPPTNPEV
jgi:hypothetical protein